MLPQISPTAAAQFMLDVRERFIAHGVCRSPHRSLALAVIALLFLSAIGELAQTRRRTVDAVVHSGFLP
jgi:hypothetical protein